MRGALFTLISTLLLTSCQCGGEVDPNDPSDGGANDPPGSDGGSDAGEAEIPFSEWCPQVERGFRNAMLQSEQRCGQTAITEAELERILVPPGLPVNQIALLIINCGPLGTLGAMNEKFATSISQGRIRYDAKKAGDCRALGRLSTQNGTPLSVRDAEGYLIEPCRGVLTGRVSGGGLCHYHEECADGLYCSPSAPGTCGGTCRTRLAPGAACNPDRDLCEVGADCLDASDAGTFTCVAREEEDGPCSSNSDCKAGLACVGPPGALRCVQRGQEGASCVEPRTDPPDCASGLHCVSEGTGATCRPAALLDEPCGEPAAGARPCGSCLRCAESDRCVSSAVGVTCARDEDCPHLSFCNGDTCAVKPKEGQACTVPASAGGDLPAGPSPGNCLYGDNFCKRTSEASGEGTCTRRPGLQEPCGSAFDRTACAEGFCDEGTCRSLRDAGEACAADSECSRGQWCAPDPLGGAEPDRCEALPADGASCTPAGNCATGHFCNDTEMCEQLRDIGASCSEDDWCQSGTCDAVNGVCVRGCNQNYDTQSCGCPTGGARDFSMFLLFAVVLLRASRSGAKPS